MNIGILSLAFGLLLLSLSAAGEAKESKTRKNSKKKIDVKQIHYKYYYNLKEI